MQLIIILVISLPKKKKELIVGLTKVIHTSYVSSIPILNNLCKIRSKRFISEINLACTVLHNLFLILYILASYCILTSLLPIVSLGSYLKLVHKLSLVL